MVLNLIIVRFCRSIAVALVVLHWVHPAVSGPQFPPVKIETNVVDPPAPVQKFIEKLRVFDRDGALEGGTQDSYGKAWVLAHVAPNFTCERDFGGICAGKTYADRIDGFLKQAGYWDGIDGVTPIAGNTAVWERFDLTPIDLDLSALLGPLERSLLQADEYCTASLKVSSHEQHNAVIQTLIENPNSGVTDELMGLYRLTGIRGTWNVRSRPDIDAAKVGKASNELVFMLGQGEIKPQKQLLPNGRTFEWYHIGLSSGQEGYIAVDAAHLMTSMSKKMCIGLIDRKTMITRHVGGGD